MVPNSNAGCPIHGEAFLIGRLRVSVRPICPLGEFSRGPKIRLNTRKINGNARKFNKSITEGKIRSVGFHTKCIDTLTRQPQVFVVLFWDCALLEGEPPPFTLVHLGSGNPVIFWKLPGCASWRAYRSG